MNKKLTFEERDILFHKITAKYYDLEIVNRSIIYYNIYFNPWIQQITKGDVLDYGCGTGCLIQRILPYTKRYYGVDHSTEMIEIAKSKFNSDKIKFIQADCLKLPFNNEKFDAVICQGIFHHLSNIERGLDEVLRVSKPRAQIYLSEPIISNSILSKFKKLLREKSNSTSVEKPLDKCALLALLNSKNIKYCYATSIWLPLPSFLQYLLIHILKRINIGGDMIFIYAQKL